MTDKITTHSLGNGWFTAAINGIPLIGNRGCHSRYSSRKEAKKAAECRLKQLTPEDRKRFGWDDLTDTSWVE